jgi:hypothetical protein
MAQAAGSRQIGRCAEEEAGAGHHGRTEDEHYGRDPVDMAAEAIGS